MDKPQLHGTPLSHFTRKIRILLLELGVPFDFERARSVLGSEPHDYADNPLMRVPTLVHRGQAVFDSDHIARYVIREFDPIDRFGAKSDRVGDLNRLAVVNGIMNNEVVLILAKRGGLSDIDKVTYFRKLASAIDNGLAWLDREVDLDDADLHYVDIATICMWQHLMHYGIAEGLDRYPRVRERVARFSERPSVAATSPEASLREATAAGWSPA